MYDIVTIGSATRDVFLRSKHFQVIKSPKFFTGKAQCFTLGTKIPIEDIDFTTGGSGTNVAVTFARQGFKGASIVRLGDDLGGGAVINELKKEKIDTKFIQIDKRNHTAYSVILIVPSGERTILVFRGAGKKLSNKEINWSKVKANWIYLASLGGNLNFVKKAVEIKKSPLARGKGKKTKLAWNPGGADLRLGLEKLRPYLKFIDVFSCNQEEAAKLLNISYKKERQIFKKFDEVIEGIAMMTKGPRGVSVSDGKYLYKAGVFKEQKITDRTGAGDAFGAGFVAGFIQTNRIEDAIRLGTANATSVVEHIGAKQGILTRNQFFKESRWKKFQIVKHKL